MNVDEIITSLATNNSRLERCRENIADWRTTIERFEREIAEKKESLRTCVEDEADLLAKRSSLLEQLKTALVENTPKNDEQIIVQNLAEPDKPKDDDEDFHLVRRPVVINGVRRVVNADGIVEVTAIDCETDEQLNLFTDNKLCIKSCTYGIGETIDVEYDEKSGELISVIVGE